MDPTHGLGAAKRNDLAELPVTRAAPVIVDRGRIQLTALGRALGWQPAHLGDG